MNQNLALMVKMIFGFLDLFGLNTFFFLMKWFFVLDESAFLHPDQYYYLWIMANLGWLICALVHRLYDPGSTNRFESYLARTFQTYLVFLLVTLTYLYFARQITISRTFVSIFLVSFPAALLMNRMFYLLVWTHIRNKEYLIKRIMIIGYNDIGKKLAHYFEKDHQQMRLVGYCEDYSNVNELSHYPILNTLGNALKASTEFRITDIYSTILPEQDHRIYELMRLADQACIRFKLVPDLSLYVNRPMYMNYLEDMPVLSQREEPLDDLGNRMKKRVFDLIVSIFAIVFILSWLVPLIGFAIWIDSKGPVFFVQKRSGQNNVPFNCIKFRSMKVNFASDMLQATKNDDRFTRVGRFIRKTNLDEFPQFLNVFIGNMSIVGPRPHMLKHTEDFSVIISKYMIRQFLKPGITGWAQVNGYRGETKKIEDMESRVNHDIWYMERWCLTLDLKIMILTIYNIFKGEKNAY